MRLDLRLVPAAVATWALAWWATGSVRPEPVLLACAGAVVGAVVLVGHGWWRRSSLTGSAGWILTCLAAVAAVAGVGVADRGGCDVQALARSSAFVEVTGVVVRDPRPAFGEGSETTRTGLTTTSLQYRGVRCPVRATLDLVVSDDAAGRSGSAGVVGERVAVVGILQEGFRGLEIVARQPPARQGMGALLAGVAGVRGDLLAVTDGLSPQARGLVPGAAIGDTTRVPDALADAMLVTSLTHITAVSGGHVAVVVAAVAWCCGAVRGPRVVRVLVAAGALCAFVVLVRPDPSVLRAAATGAVGLLALTLRRPATAIPALAAAVVVLLVVDPWLARSYGFVLSTAATAGLVTMAQPIARRIPGPRWLAFAVAVPVAAQVACGPVLVLLEPALPLYGVPANLLACLALAPATVLGLLATILAPWWPAAAFVVAWCAGLATWWIAGVATFFASLPGASLAWPEGLPGACGLAALTALGVEGLRRAFPVEPTRTRGH